MYPPGQRTQRLGQSQRPNRTPHKVVQHHEASPPARVVRALQRRRGPSRKTQDRQEITTSTPWMVSTGATYDDSNVSQNQERHDIQSLDPMSITQVFQEVQDKLYWPIAAIETAVADMAQENERRFKTTAWLLDELEFKVQTLAAAVEANAALTKSWNEMAG